jgi:Zn-dependent metalloprotease
MSLTPKLLSFAVLMALGGTAAAATLNNAAADRAQSIVGAHRAELKASDQDRFSLVSSNTDRNGDVHTRMTRTYAGLRVLEGDVVLHDNGRGACAASR